MKLLTSGTWAHEIHINRLPGHDNGRKVWLGRGQEVLREYREDRPRMADAAAWAICDAATNCHTLCIDGRPFLTGPAFEQAYDENTPDTFRILADALNTTGLPGLGS